MFHLFIHGHLYPIFIHSQGVAVIAVTTLNSADTHCIWDTRLKYTFSSMKNWTLQMAKDRCWDTYRTLPFLYHYSLLPLTTTVTEL